MLVWFGRHFGVIRFYSTESKFGTLTMRIHTDTWYTYLHLLTTARPRGYRKTCATGVDTGLRSS